MLPGRNRRMRRSRAAVDRCIDVVAKPEPGKVLHGQPVVVADGRPQRAQNQPSTSTSQRCASRTRAALLSMV
jgi:hypothetical protein